MKERTSLIQFDTPGRYRTPGRLPVLVPGTRYVPYLINVRNACIRCTGSLHEGATGTPCTWGT